MAALALADYVYGPVCSALDPTDRALCIAEKIAEQSAMEAELEELRGKVAEDVDHEENAEHLHAEHLHEVLTKLIEAIDNAKIGKVARVGSLVVIEPHANTLEVSLGDALKAARAAL